MQRRRQIEQIQPAYNLTESEHRSENTILSLMSERAVDLSKSCNVVTPCKRSKKEALDEDGFLLGYPSEIFGMKKETNAYSPMHPKKKFCIAPRKKGVINLFLDNDLVSCRQEEKEGEKQTKHFLPISPLDSTPDLHSKRMDIVSSPLQLQGTNDMKSALEKFPSSYSTPHPCRNRLNTSRPAVEPRESAKMQRVVNYLALSHITPPASIQQELIRISPPPPPVNPKRQNTFSAFHNYQR